MGELRRQGWDGQKSRTPLHYWEEPQRSTPGGQHPLGEHPDQGMKWRVRRRATATMPAQERKASLAIFALDEDIPR